MNDDIVRTAALDGARSLAFGNSAAYLVDHTSGDWAISTLRELFVPFATYRLSDSNLHARMSRVGTKCRITTHASDAGIFGEGLASIDIPCDENTLPVGFGSNVLFAGTRTGVRISPDGLTLEPLSAAEVVTMVAKIPTGFCYIPRADGAKGGSLVEFLDQAPSRILCVAGEK